MNDKNIDLMLDIMAVLLVAMMIMLVTDAFAYDKEWREKRRANEMHYQACMATCSMSCPAVKK